jgi:hypothetical protein
MRNVVLCLLLLVCLAIGGLVYAKVQSSGSEGFVCPVTGEVLPCEECCPFKDCCPDCCPPEDCCPQAKP